MRLKLKVLILGILTILSTSAVSAQTRTKNVVLIVSDGLRWQEVFTGADPTLLSPEDKHLRERFWNDAATKRREMLFPFLWTVIAKQGQIYGNQNLGSVARVTNKLDFSYPGYNEMITGRADPRINSNEYGPNPNISVFEWLNHQPEFQAKAAVFATWETFKDIFNQPRSKLMIQAGWDPPEGKGSSRDELLRDLFRATTRFDGEDTYNSFVQFSLLDYLKREQPRVLFVGYGETDNWAHAGRYDLVLQSANKFDQFVKQLWETMQAMPQYRGQTTFILTADHGRGSGTEEWKNHGVEQKGSENIWIAVLGPDTSPLGERSNVPEVTQSQIAATVAALLGKDFTKASPEAAAPLPVISK